MNKIFKLFNQKDKNNIFVMADLGLTNGGDLDRAISLINIAVDLGVDAVKFQMLDANELLGDKSVSYTYPTLLQGDKTENMCEMFKKLEFNDTEWGLIKSECDKNKIGLVVTSHVESAVERIEKLNLPVNKICTWSLSHYRMIAMLAKNGKPLIIDTGTINFDQLSELSSYYLHAGGSEVLVLFDFHTQDLSDTNFNAISQLLNAGYAVGYTPQGRDDWLDYMSVGLGINFIEKRLTLSREIPENGHWKAHEPEEFGVWINNIRNCYRSLGDNVLTPTQADLISSSKWYKSAWLDCDVSAGEIIQEKHFIFKRPGHGISSRDIQIKYLGKKFIKSFKAGEMFTI